MTSVSVSPLGFVGISVSIHEAEATIPNGHYLALNGKEIVASGPWPPSFDLSVFEIERLYVPTAVYAELAAKYR